MDALLSSSEATKRKGAERDCDELHVAVRGGAVETETCSVVKRKPGLACRMFIYVFAA